MRFSHQCSIAALAAAMWLSACDSDEIDATGWFAGCDWAMANGATSISVSWSPGEREVHVYVATAPGGQDFTSPAASATGASVEVTGLEPETTYYVVCRVDADTNTHEVSASTEADTTAPSFDGVQIVANATAGSLDLSWDAASDDVSDASEIVYEIFARSSMAHDFDTPAATTKPGATQHTLSGLDSHTRYFVVVRARDAAGNRESNSIELDAATLASFANDVQPLFASHCAGCHSAASPAAGLALDAGAYASLCGEGTSCTPVKSTKHLTFNRIEPNNTANSFLYLKVTGNLPPATECMSNDCGSAMPPSFCGDCMPLSPEELQLLADWIDEGAQNL